MRHVDALVIGQGLAGTTLAWQLLGRGASVAVVEGDCGPCASRVAAGLLAPVGGKRMALAWRAKECWPSAIEFYRTVERKLDQLLLQELPIVRLFTDQQQQYEFERRAAGPLSDHVLSHSTELSSEAFVVAGSGCQVRGARLDVAGYLDASRQWLADRDSFYALRLESSKDWEVREDMVVCDQLGISADRLVLCRGFSEADSGNAVALPFEPAQGEVLTLRAPGLEEARVVQQGVWLAPMAGGLYKVGSTFCRDQCDGKPTKAGRAEIERRLRRFLALPYEVIDHQAGVRPIVRSRRPLAGPLPGQACVAVFNGLGASGTLWGPWVAGRLADWMLNGTQLPAEFDPRERLGNH